MKLLNHSKLRIVKFNIFLLLFFWINCGGWKPSILSGPMVGGVGMRSALIWIQMDYRSKSLQDKLEIQINGRTVTSAKVNPRTGIATFELDELEPGQVYKYQIFGYPEARGEFQTKPLWKFRESVAPNFSFIIASCHYVNEEPYDRKGEPWGSHFEIFHSIEKEKADFFLWMGDNVYLREADWDSPLGILHRYSHTRALPESKNVFRNMPHYAIWDDHDYGPNDASKAYSLSHIADATFKDFWPDFNYPKKGIYRNFTWGDAEFFLLDNRRFRSANHNLATDNRTILGEEQLEWLFHAISDSTAAFKFIVMGGQFLNSSKVYENYSNYADERRLILNTIRKLKLKNVIFLTGDRHHSEISVISNDGETPIGFSNSTSSKQLDRSSAIYEFTVSPLTAGIPSSPIQEKNLYRIPGSLYQKRLYGIVDIQSVGKNRKVRIQFKDSIGNIVHTYSID